MDLLFADGLADGLWLEADGIKTSIIEKTSFDILQATSARINKTEYISCPTCGRTSFNLGNPRTYQTFYLSPERSEISHHGMCGEWYPAKWLMQIMDM